MTLWMIFVRAKYVLINGNSIAISFAEKALLRVPVGMFPISRFSNVILPGATVTSSSAVFTPSRLDMYADMRSGALDINER